MLQGGKMALTQADNIAWFREHQLGHQQHFHQTAIITMLIYSALFSICQTTSLPKRLFSTFKQEHVTDWNQRLMETMNAFVVVAGCLICIQEARPYDVSWVFGYRPVQEIMCSVMVGYMLFDTGFNFVYMEMWDTCDIIHHALFVFLASWHLGAGSLYKVQFIFLAVGEVVVPFMNLRWHLAVTGQKAGQLYVWNAMALWVAFMFSRVVVMGAGLLMSWRHMWGSWYDVPSPAFNKVHRTLLLVLLSCYLLNLYWVWGISKAVLRLLQRQRKHSLYDTLHASNFRKHAHVVRPTAMIS